MSIANSKLNVGGGLDLEITNSSSNEHSKVFNVTITPHESPNTSEPNDTRLYVSENTADGTYKAKFFTPATTGLTSRTENSNIILCDEIEIEFEVVGSVHDDLNTHIS